MTIHQVVFGVRTFQASVSCRAARDVTCERCGEEYVYVVFVESSGSGRSLMGLDDAAAMEVAKKHAVKDLVHRVRAAAEPVACPQCGWYQRDMVARACRDRGSAGIFLAFLGFVLALCLVAIGARDRERVLLTAAGVMACVGVGGVCLCLARWRWDPNSDEAWKAGRRLEDSVRAIRKTDWRDDIHGRDVVLVRDSEPADPGLVCGGCNAQMVAGDATCEACGWTWGDAPIGLR